MVSRATHQHICWQMRVLQSYYNVVPSYFPAWNSIPWHSQPGMGKLQPEGHMLPVNLFTLASQTFKKIH